MGSPVIYLQCNQALIFKHSTKDYYEKTLITLFSLFLAVPAFSQDKEEDKGKFTFSGYIDSYYLANFNNPRDMKNTGASGTARAFDQKLDFHWVLFKLKLDMQQLSLM